MFQGILTLEKEKALRNEVFADDQNTLNQDCVAIRFHNNKFRRLTKSLRLFIFAR